MDGQTGDLFAWSASPGARRRAPAVRHAKILALSAYVAMAGLEGKGGPVSREGLMAVLWPELEPRRAQAVLRRDLSLLKKALGGEWLVIGRQEIGTDPDADFWLDGGHFRRLTQASNSHGHAAEEVCPQCVAELEEAAALCWG